MFKLYTDGGSRGNPGSAAYGALLFDENDVLQDFTAGFIGETTNNMAEYQGLIYGLELAQKAGVQELKVYMDSELIVMQMNGAYRVKQKQLKIEWEKAKGLLEKFTKVTFVHVRREKNKHADKLVNMVLDSVKVS